VGAVQTPTKDDHTLMRAIADGDQAALGALYDRHSALLFALALRMLRDRMEAEDLVLEVFWEIWRKRDRYDSGRSNPMTYLLMLTRSRCIDRRRSGSRQRELAAQGDVGDGATTGLRTTPAAEGPVGNAMFNELSERVRAAMARLEMAQRQAVELSFFDDLSHSEIAERLGKPLGTVKTNIRQGLIHLRESMRMD
jgi:RNA polymerase sigma-70 factor (ECF subfamily)